MTLAAVKPDDVVYVDIKGRKFMALVSEKTAGGLKITPLDPRVTHHHAKATEVIGHWSKRANTQVPFLARAVAA